MAFGISFLLWSKVSAGLLNNVGRSAGLSPKVTITSVLKTPLRKWGISKQILVKLDQTHLCQY